MLQLHFTCRTPLQLNDSPAKEIGAPVTHASQPLTLFTRLSHSEVYTAWVCTILRKRLLISNFQVFQDVAHCTTALIDCMASIYMHLGLAKDDER